MRDRCWIGMVGLVAVAFGCFSVMGAVPGVQAGRGGAAATEPGEGTRSVPATLGGTVVTQHPALFLVGDSIMNTGTGDGSTGPWGWGAEIAGMFDSKKVHVYNEGHGGRSSRGYIEEGLWKQQLARMEKGDFVIVEFGHNDAANSANYPDRISGKGAGDELSDVPAGYGAAATGTKAVHSYGWYLKQYVKEAKEKGAVVIVCSPVPRNTWAEGKIKRGFDGYVGWAEAAAKESGAFYIDLNKLAADRFDALGQQKTAALFNDNQHTKKAGAKLNAEAVVEGLRGLKECGLKEDLLPVAASGAVK
ncbi:MAG TPA: rhamnogalacturonan acetylesterase [Phycisphaerae bacterium]|nr:rhamnogalacturonan acetylesterase [Phycisphaerae bacterium]